MAGTVVADTFKSSTTSPPAFQNTSGTQIGTLCRAWANFSSSGGVMTVNNSFNISSITYLGTGSYQANFTTAMPSANYSVVGASTSVVGTATTCIVTTFRRDTDTRVANTTTTTTFSTCNSNNSTALNMADGNIAVFA